MVGRVIVVDETGKPVADNASARIHREVRHDRALRSRRSGPARPPGGTIHLQAERLVKVNAVVSVVALLVGAIAAVLLVLTRWQAVHLLPAVWYYRILGVHGMSMLIFFIIFFEMAVLCFASTVLLNARPAAPKTRLVRLRADAGRRADGRVR